MKYHFVCHDCAEDSSRESHEALYDRHHEARSMRDYHEWESGHDCEYARVGRRGPHNTDALPVAIENPGRRPYIRFMVAVERNDDELADAVGGCIVHLPAELDGVVP